MKIAIIGSGWLGLPLAEKLRNNGHTVFSTKRTGSQSINKILQFPSSDGETEKLLTSVDVAVLAFPPNRSSIIDFSNDCLRITELLNNNCKVLMISSTSVYPNNNQLATEDSLRPDAFPENSIALAEKVLRNILGNRLTALRLAGLVGAGRYPVSAMSKGGKKHVSNEPVNVIHREDAAGLAAYLIDQQIWGEIVNGCAQEHPSKEVFYTWMASELKIPAPIFENAEPKGKTVSSEKSRVLGYRYSYDNPFDCMKA